MVFRIVVTRVFDDALALFKGEIESAEGGVAKLEIFDNAQRVQIVVERKSVLLHCCVERFFTGMSKRRMAKVVHKREGLGQIGVEAKLSGNGARYRRHLDGVSQAIAKVVGVATGKNLGLRFEPAEGAGMDNAITVALKIVAIRMLRLGMATSAGIFDAHRVVGEHETSLPQRQGQLELLRARR